MRSLLFFIVLACTLAACNKGKNNPESCNGSSTRRDVKICIDAASNQIDLTPINIDVAGIGALEVPEIDKDDPRQAVEKKVFTITARVHKLSKHRDGDWKVKLTDGNDKYVNCENPNPGCEYAKESEFYDAFVNAREWIEANKNDLEGKTVTITGVGFIDIDHKYPRNAADNEMELHPILSIHF
ncbi:MAG: hypothetical protein NXI10_08130 [bacterium]|nr:hypothetical protein [bacterium]